MKDSNDNKDTLVKLIYSDGFSERLLEIEFLVNNKYQFELVYESYKIAPAKLIGELPINISDQLTELIDCDLSKLDTQYGIHEGASDFSYWKIIINQHDKFRDYLIGEIPTIDIKTSTTTEKMLFHLLHSRRDWTLNQVNSKLS